MIIGCKEMLTIGTNDLRLTLLQLDLVPNGLYPPFVAMFVAKK